MDLLNVPKRQGPGISQLLPGALFLAVLPIVVWGLIQAKEFFIPICMSALLALMMSPIARLLKRFGFPETLAVLSTTVLLYLPLLGLASLIFVEAGNLIRNWPTIAQSVQQNFDQVTHLPYVAKFGLASHLQLSSLQAQATARMGEGAMIIFTGLKALLSASTTTILVLTFAGIMLGSRNHLRKSFEAILAVGERPDRAVMLDSALSVIEKFLLARVMIIAFVAIASFIVLQIFGVSYSVTLSILLGLSTLVPVVGFFIGIIPALLIAAAGGATALSAGGLFLALWAISSLQDHVLTPKLIGRRLDLNFLATYLAIFAGEQIWGLWGMFLSIPALGLLRVLLASSDDYKAWGILLAEEDVIVSLKPTAPVASEGQIELHPPLPQAAVIRPESA